MNTVTYQRVNFDFREVALTLKRWKGLLAEARGPRHPGCAAGTGSDAMGDLHRIVNQFGMWFFQAARQGDDPEKNMKHYNDFQSYQARLEKLMQRPSEAGFDAAEKALDELIKSLE